VLHSGVGSWSANCKQGKERDIVHLGMFQILDWAKISSKQSCLYIRSVNGVDKKFYNIDSRGLYYKPFRVVIKCVVACW